MIPLGRWGRGGGEIIFMVGAKKGFVILARCGTERLNVHYCLLPLCGKQTLNFLTPSICFILLSVLINASGIMVSGSG